MANLLLSKFETYLLDEEIELESQQPQLEFGFEEAAKYEEYPPGFFTEL